MIGTVNREPMHHQESHDVKIFSVRTLIGAERITEANEIYVRREMKLTTSPQTKVISSDIREEINGRYDCNLIETKDYNNFDTVDRKPDTVIPNKEVGYIDPKCENETSGKYRVGADVLLYLYSSIQLKYSDVLITGNTQYLYSSTFIKYSYFYHKHNIVFNLFPFLFIVIFLPK